jgi:hypothetical protein
MGEDQDPEPERGHDGQTRKDHSDVFLEDPVLTRPTWGLAVVLDGIDLQRVTPR